MNTIIVQRFKLENGTILEAEYDRRKYRVTSVYDVTNDISLTEVGIMSFEHPLSKMWVMAWADVTDDTIFLEYTKYVNAEPI